MGEPRPPNGEQTQAEINALYKRTVQTLLTTPPKPRKKKPSKRTRSRS